MDILNLLTADKAIGPITTLDDLASTPIWAARGLKSGKEKRAPVDTRTNRFASCADPSTWATREEAEACAVHLMHEAGVGIMLGSERMPEGLVLGGLDLDGCRSEGDQGIAGWAETVVLRFDTYTEISPSGSGLRLFFLVRSQDFEALKRRGLIKNFGRSFTGGGVHKETAISLGRKYMSVTGMLYSDMLGDRNRLNVVALRELEWLIGDFGPKFAATKSANTDRNPRSGDQSGSGFAFRFALDCIEGGMNEDETRRAFAENTDEAGDWWARTEERQQDRTIANAKKCMEARVADILTKFDDLEMLEEEEPIDAVLRAMNFRYAATILGGRCVVADVSRGTPSFMTTTALREVFGNYLVDKKKLGQWWLDHPKRRTFDRGITFDPSGNSPVGALNLWGGWGVQPDASAGCELILEHIHQVICGRDEDLYQYVMSWLAHLVQFPEEKIGVALVLVGAKGSGKDTLVEIMRPITGSHYAHADSLDRLLSRFNKPFATALLGHVEEAFWAGDRKAKGQLQSFITSPTMPLEIKGADTVQVNSYTRFILTTNEERAIPATVDERRYAVIKVADHRRGDHEYFDPLYREMNGDGSAGFLSYLQKWKIPTGLNLRRAPRTQALTDQKLTNLRDVAAWFYDSLASGEAPFGFENVGEWREGSVEVPKAEMRDHYDRWLRRHPFRGEAISEARFGRELKIYCPDVRDTRPCSKGERGRVQSYVFPRLSECREKFAHAIGGVVVWEADND